MLSGEGQLFVQQLSGHMMQHNFIPCCLDRLTSQSYYFLPSKVSLGNYAVRPTTGCLSRVRGKCKSRDERKEKLAEVSVWPPPLGGRRGWKGDLAHIFGLASSWGPTICAPLERLLDILSLNANPLPVTGIGVRVFLFAPHKELKGTVSPEPRGRHAHLPVRFRTDTNLNDLLTCGLSWNHS